MKAIVISLLLTMGLVLACESEAREGPSSATAARDVNGIELGITFDQLRRRMDVEHVAFETVSGTAEGIAYELGLTPAGRVFRIESVQSLGRFEPDADFTETLEGRLTAKYGPPSSSSLPVGPANWQLTEQFADAAGTVQSRQVMWANAMLSSEASGLSLIITMVDFRILWEDQGRQNGPRAQEAAEAMRF